MIKDSVILYRISKMKENKYLKEDLIVEEEEEKREPSTIVPDPKMTHITFNNFDGDKIQKQNEYFKISELSEEESQSESKNDPDSENGSEGGIKFLDVPVSEKRF